MQINILSRKSQENLAKASNKGGKAVSPTDSIDLGSVVAALSCIFGNVVMAFILSFFFYSDKGYLALSPHHPIDSRLFESIFYAIVFCIKWVVSPYLILVIFFGLTRFQA